MKTVVAAAIFALQVACAGQSNGPGAQDPVRQAENEYDIARDLWLNRGQLREALEHALKAVELDEDNADAQHLTALLYLDFCARRPGECRLEDAERHARKAVEIRPDFREARNTLGVTLIHNRKPREAVAVLKPLSDDILYQTPEKAWGNLGWAYLEAGDLDRAVDALRRSIAAQPLFCVGSFRLGLALERKGELVPAQDAFTRALETEAPECSRLQDAVAGRARIASRLGQTEQARADLARCVELASTTTTGKNCRSMLEKLK
ncbi:MAG TPA: tetratricopeptide repeat protein [Polyangiaceae bacterium]